MTKFGNLSDSLCEDALAILQEIVDADVGLHIWFDRSLDVGHGSLVDTQLGNLQSVFTSRGQDTKNPDSRLMSKREVKRSAFEIAISTSLEFRIDDTEKQKERDKEQ